MKSRKNYRKGTASALTSATKFVVDNGSKKLKGIVLSFIYNAVTNFVIKNSEGTADLLKFDNVLNFPNLNEYADNASAIDDGLVVGDVYHTSGVLKVVFEV